MCIIGVDHSGCFAKIVVGAHLSGVLARHPFEGRCSSALERPHLA